MTSGLTALQEKFIELMLSDTIYTNKEMAEVLECDERTVYKMKRNDRVGKELERLADAGLKININRAYGVLTDILFSEDTAAKDKIKALDLYLKTQGKLKEKTEMDANVKVSNAEKAEAELEKLLNM